MEKINVNELKFCNELKKAPHRRKNIFYKAAVFACVVILGLFAFSVIGYGNESAIESELPRPQHPHMHYPLEQLERSGLNVFQNRASLDYHMAEAYVIMELGIRGLFLIIETIPEHVALVPTDAHFNLPVELTTYDSRFDVALAVAFVHANLLEFTSTEEISQAFSHEINNLIVGVFYNPEVPVSDAQVIRTAHPTVESAYNIAVTDDAHEEIFNALVNNLDRQIENFVRLLISEGILNEEGVVPPREIAVIQDDTIITTQEFLQSGVIMPRHSGINVELNGTLIQFDVPPMVVDGRTLVPMRAIFQALRYNTSWFEEQQVITAVRGSHRIHMQIGETQMMVNNNAIELEVAPQIIEGRTLVPLRAIAEAVGAHIHWDADTRTVEINTSLQPAAEENFVYDLFTEARWFLMGLDTWELLAMVNAAELETRIQVYGAGASQSLVANFSEQDAFTFIRTILEGAGLDFSAVPPNYNVDVIISRPDGLRNVNIGLDLFDERNNVAITNFGENISHFMESDHVRAMFSQQDSNLVVGAFFNPFVPVRGEDLTEEEIFEAKRILMERIIFQTHELIHRLQFGQIQRIQEIL
jgi:hypothetical protein